MAVSGRAESSAAEPLPVQTYQLFITANGLFVQPLVGPDPSRGHPIKTDDNNLSYRTLMMLHSMLLDGRLREDEQELFGEYLYDVLLDNAVGEAIHEALNKKPSCFIRVELNLSSAPRELQNLPWEYLRRPSTKDRGGYFLATQGRLALVRCPRLGTIDPLRLQAGEKLRVLLVACSPSDEAALEFAPFIEMMKTLPNIDLQMLITAHVKDKNWKIAEDERAATRGPEATIDNFREALRTKPHFVHFLGHGRVDPKGGSIAFVNPDYTADWCKSTELKGIFDNSSDARLLFLQACETSAPNDAVVAYRALSSVAGELASTGIPAIVAMQTKIRIGEANDFASVLYRSIIKDRLPLFRAMQVARQKVGAAACIPVLYLRYDPERADQAGLLFEETPGEPGQVSPGARGRGESVEGGKCPWCRTALDPSQAKEDCCLECGSDLRCPNCKGEIAGFVPEGAERIRCQKRGCQQLIFRYKDAPTVPASTLIDKPLQSQGPDSARTAEAVSTHASGEDQKDVFEIAGAVGGGEGRRP